MNIFIYLSFSNRKCYRNCYGNNIISSKASFSADSEHYRFDYIIHNADAIFHTWTKQLHPDCWQVEHFFLIVIFVKMDSNRNQLNNGCYSIFCFSYLLHTFAIFCMVFFTSCCYSMCFQRTKTIRLTKCFRFFLLFTLKFIKFI